MRTTVGTFWMSSCTCVGSVSYTLIRVFFTLALGRLGLIWPVDLMDIDRFHINFLVLGSEKWTPNE